MAPLRYFCEVHFVLLARLMSCNSVNQFGQELVKGIWDLSAYALHCLLCEKYSIRYKYGKFSYPCAQKTLLWIPTSCTTVLKFWSGHKLQFHILLKTLALTKNFQVPG